MPGTVLSTTHILIFCGYSIDKVDYPRVDRWAKSNQVEHRQQQLEALSCPGKTGQGLPMHQLNHMQ